MSENSTQDASEDEAKREARSSSSRKARTRNTRGWFKTLMSFAGRCRGRMILAEILSIISVFSGLVPFYSIYRIIDEATSVASPAEMSWDVVMFWVGIAILFYALQQLFFAASTVNSHISAYTILGSLREGIATKLMNASLGTARSKSIGNLKNLVIDRIEQIEIPLAHFIPELSANLLLALAIVVWFVVIDWRLALACIVTVPIGLLVLTLGMQGYYKMYDGYMDEQDRVNSVVVEYIEGIHVVKAFNQATSSYAKFSSAVTGFLSYTLEWMRTSWVATSLAMSVLPTTLLGVVPVGIALYLGGELDPASFGLACVLAIAVVTPVTYLGKAFNDINLVAYCITDAREFLELPELTQGDKPIAVADYGVEISDARFSYIDGVEVLHGVDLSVPAGSFTALVGPSGSGKSTIARLIMRHWDVDSGSVSIGGVDVRKMPLSQLSSLVSVVSQDDFLLDGTLRENVAMGRPGASDEEIDAACRAASCEEFIGRLPKGWDTPAGEAGHALSGGERQRICIARAILKDAPIVVFDEATAFADPENEARIQRSVARLSEGKTLVVIAHRLSTITAADCICVVNDGQIVARGTHDELLAQNDLYASMWKAHIGAADWAAGSHVGEAAAQEGGDAR
ncbi:ABC transporter ATP-binding protein [Denitrobacterium detoxificans]|uniref:ATP-binding cassette, subfamily B n=1 Tax=Denitrobacterium detoxificans TaxID=79604 RepID=A0A1H8UD80_9ACTN|nr:ABC transporter ATP-binding protein [Denitrobacterium detoxificans]SEP01066.1 ATP-binding cassette, subfamily B [Denitrobacterium detoxificans]